MDIQRLIKRKNELKITNQELADISGISLGTITGCSDHMRQGQNGWPPHQRCTGFCS